jgi:hypothetical protein
MCPVVTHFTKRFSSLYIQNIRIHTNLLSMDKKKMSSSKEDHHKEVNKKIGSTEEHLGSEMISQADVVRVLCDDESKYEYNRRKNRQGAAV